MSIVAKTPPILVPFPTTPFSTLLYSTGTLLYHITQSAAVAVTEVPTGIRSERSSFRQSTPIICQKGGAVIARKSLVRCAPTRSCVHYIAVWCVFHSMLYTRAFACSNSCLPAKYSLLGAPLSRRTILCHTLAISVSCGSARRKSRLLLYLFVATLCYTVVILVNRLKLFQDLARGTFTATIHVLYANEGSMFCGAAVWGRSLGDGHGKYVLHSSRRLFSNPTTNSYYYGRLQAVLRSCCII